MLWLIWLVLGILVSTALSGFLSGVIPDVSKEEMKKVIMYLPLSILIVTLYIPAKIISTVDDAVWELGNYFCSLGKRVAGQNIEEENVQE